MRSPPYFARMRRSSMRQPSRKPMTSVATDATSATIHGGREGIMPSDENSGGFEDWGASDAAVSAGFDSAGGALAGAGGTAIGAGDDKAALPAAFDAAAALAALRALARSASSFVFSWRSFSSSSVRAFSCSRNGGADVRYDVRT